MEAGEHLRLSTRLPYTITLSRGLGGPRTCDRPGKGMGVSFRSGYHRAGPYQLVSPRRAFGVPFVRRPRADKGGN